MTKYELVYFWQGIAVIGKGITYILLMMALIKYIIT
jgi:hypothetical protein